ncbi:MAG: ATP synthase F1 subunit gamma [Oscillospiraceae bacterium]
MKDIKLRIKSVESTMQITKAMELVASSKLRKAKIRVEKSRPYFVALYKTLNDIAASNTEFSSVFLKERPEVKKVGYVIIAGDRGLAGGYNSNMFKLFLQHSQGKEVCAIPVGKKAVEFCKRKNIEIVSDEFAIAEDVSVSACSRAGALMTAMFKAGEIDEVYIGYTTFVSMLSQEATMMKVLPLVNIEAQKEREKTDGPKVLTLYEPSSESLFNIVVPQYVSGLVYGALAESWASELGARRTAMDSASKNASEMVDELSLKYNRARQAVITSEITEIVSGADALK